MDFLEKPCHRSVVSQVEAHYLEQWIPAALAEGLSKVSMLRVPY